MRIAVLVVLVMCVIFKLCGTLVRIIQLRRLCCRRPRQHSQLMGDALIHVSMPFGIFNAPATFHQLMELELCDLQRHMLVVYIIRACTRLKDRKIHVGLETIKNLETQHGKPLVLFHRLLSNKSANYS